MTELNKSSSYLFTVSAYLIIVQVKHPRILHVAKLQKTHKKELWPYSQNRQASTTDSPRCAARPCWADTSQLIPLSYQNHTIAEQTVQEQRCTMGGAKWAAGRVL